MKRQLLALMALAACTATAQAANYSWLGGATSNWTDAGSWWNLDTGATATPPAAGDLAIVGFPLAGFATNPRPVIATVPYTVAAPLGWLGMDWWNEVDAAPENASLAIAAGGALVVNHIWMNNGGQETATINITGGGYIQSLVHVQMGMTAGGTSQINIDSGFLYTPSLIFGPGTSKIDLEPGAYLYLAGDQTAAVQGWIGTGKITGGGGALQVQYTYNTPLAGLTAVFAVEPVTFLNGYTGTSSQVFDTSTEVQAYAGDVSNADLLQGITPTASGEAWKTLNGASPTYLNDGTHGGQGVTPIQGGWTSVGAVATYVLGLGPNGHGFDITDIQSIAEWGSGGLGNQAWTVAVSLIGSPTTFTDLAVVTYNPLAGPPRIGGSTKVTLADLNATGIHSIRVTGNAVISDADFVWRELDVFGAPSGVNETSPEIATLSPPDNATGVPVLSNLVATFNKPIALTGSGTITLKNLSGGADIPIALPSNVSISGNVLAINPATNLVAGQQYAVEISSDAITDIGTPPFTFAGLASPDWSFTASPAGTHVKVFLLGGQSNAVGLGATSGLPTSPVNLQQPQHDVLFYANYPDPGWGLTTLRPGSGVDFGPEVTFGRAVADASPAVTYAIIKHAVGATNLYNQWAPGTGTIYSDFRNTVAAGLAALQAAGYTTEIVGMVWHQGESDALDGQQAAYQTNLTNFIADIRSRYGANLRFLIGEIGDKYEPALAALNTVIAAQQAVAAADPLSVFVPAKDLTFQDILHFDTAGMITLGERFATGYASLLPPADDFAAWIANPTFGIAPSARGFGDDPDGDGLDNGAEAWFGTHPGQFSQGLVSGAVNSGAGTFTFTHPHNATPASDVSATYRWSKNLATFTAGGVAFEGTTVTFSPGAPSGGFVTVTATVSGTVIDKLFVNVMITQD